MTRPSIVFWFLFSCVLHDNKLINLILIESYHLLFQSSDFLKIVTKISFDPKHFPCTMYVRMRGVPPSIMVEVQNKDGAAKL